MKPLILSSAIISENETSEKQVEAINMKVSILLNKIYTNVTVIPTHHAITLTQIIIAPNMLKKVGSMG